MQVRCLENNSVSKREEREIFASFEESFDSSEDKKERIPSGQTEN